MHLWVDKAAKRSECAGLPALSDVEGLTAGVQKREQAPALQTLRVIRGVKGAGMT